MQIVPTGFIWAMESLRFAQLCESVKSFVNNNITIEDATENKTGLIVNNGVGKINVRGYLDKYPSGFLSFIGGTSYINLKQSVRAAVADPKVETILLSVDSPGGSVDGLAEIGDELFKVRQSKPIVAQVDGMAASAAYYIASQANQIFSHRMDEIGSIGTRLMLYDFSDAFADEGVEAVAIDTGEFKSAGAMGTKITESQRDYFQGIVNNYFDDFLSVIIRGRGMSKKDLSAIADGRMFTAKDAVANGLIDGIQTFEETVTSIASTSPKQTNRRASKAETRLRLKNYKSMQSHVKK